MNIRTPPHSPPPSNTTQYTPFTLVAPFLNQSRSPPTHSTPAPGPLAGVTSSTDCTESLELSVRKEDGEWWSINRKVAEATVQKMASSESERLIDSHFQCSFLGMHSFTPSEPQTISATPATPEQDCCSEASPGLSTNEGGLHYSEASPELSTNEDGHHYSEASPELSTNEGGHHYSEASPELSTNEGGHHYSEASLELSTNEGGHHYSARYMGMNSFLSSTEGKLTTEEGELTAGGASWQLQEPSYVQEPVKHCNYSATYVGMTCY